MSDKLLLRFHNYRGYYEAEIDRAVLAKAKLINVADYEAINGEEYIELQTGEKVELDWGELVKKSWHGWEDMECESKK